MALERHRSKSPFCRNEEVADGAEEVDTTSVPRALLHEDGLVHVPLNGKLRIVS